MEDTTVVEPEVKTEIEDLTPPVEEAEKKEETQPPAENEGEEEAGDLVITLGDEETPPQENDNEADSTRIKEMRQSLKDSNKEKKQLKKRLEELEGSKKQDNTIALGEKPTLASCDYDEDKYSSDMDSYYDRKRQVNIQEEAQKQDVKNQEAANAKVFSNYNEKKVALKVNDYQEREDNVVEVLSMDQQNIILAIASDSAKLVYALGNNETKLKELSNIKDPLQFAASVARLETTMKVSNRKKAPAPEKKVVGGNGNLGSNDKKLEQLKTEAYDSGDFTKLNAYKKQLKK